MCGTVLPQTAAHLVLLCSTWVLEPAVLPDLDPPHVELQVVQLGHVKHVVLCAGSTGSTGAMRGSTCSTGTMGGSTWPQEAVHVTCSFSGSRL